MKIIRNIIAFILSCLLFLVIFILSISIVFNETVKKDLLPNIIRETIIKSIGNNNQTDMETIRNKMTTFTELDGFDDLVSYGVDEVIECKKDNRSVSDEAVNKFIDFIKKNKEKYQQIFDVEISDEQIESDEYKDGIRTFFNDEIKKLDIPVDNTTISIIKTYKNFTSNKYQIYLIIVGVLLIALLILVRWSWYKWLKDVSVPLLFAGVNIGLSCIAFKLLESFLISRFDISITIVNSQLIATVITEIIVGIILYVIYKVFDNKKEKN